MSSACVCHTDEWCFYCNIYSPLEREHSILKVEIQRVIDDLDEEAKYHDKMYKNIRIPNREYHEGRVDGLDKTIKMLKELIPK